MAASAFKARALPIHVNITHTPPVLADDGTVTLASTDPGFIGTTALVPSTFATGSYGWKGNKRFTVELENPEGGEEKEKVHVILTCVVCLLLLPTLPFVFWGYFWGVIASGWLTEAFWLRFFDLMN